MTGLQLPRCPLACGPLALDGSVGEAQQLLVPCGQREAQRAGVGLPRGTGRRGGMPRGGGKAARAVIRPEAEARNFGLLDVLVPPKCIIQNDLIFLPLLIDFSVPFPSRERRHRTLKWLLFSEMLLLVSWYS